MKPHRKSALIAAFAALALGTGIAAAAGPMFHQANPNEFDPGHTFLVQAAWISGIGCPTNATYLDYYHNDAKTSYTDPACTTGDSKDKSNEGLLLAKTGPTANDAEPYAELKDLKNATITEVGYDIRKQNSSTDPSGSTCSVEAPMFQIVSSSGVSYIGCNSPAPTSQVVGNGWLRLRWTTSLTNVSAIYIVSQDGQDSLSADTSHFGLSVIDNIDLNGTLVGQGPGGH
ncbi:MAG TPA: hypothetical protein VNF73_17810 [Candidatus Saccharimonadales bacterium]|nr:hypothetical protein [Candidatus Saccharimonadales bacterium]